MKKQSQRKLILEHLKTGASITGLEALRKYGCYRLSDVIYKLRKEEHIIITADASSHGNHYGAYFLVDKEL